MSGPAILFVADAGLEVGGGHVMRSLTLAEALKAAGASCRFTAPPAVTALLSAFAPDMVQVPAASTVSGDLAGALSAERFDAVVFDHYSLGAGEHRAMAQGKPALIIDDLADRALGGDLILDSGPTRSASDYDGLMPEGARLLLGPQYAPVRPEFAALRDTALTWRGEPVGRVLVSLGLTDLGGITGRVVERIRPKIGEAGLDIVLGAEAPSLASLEKIARRDTRIALHIDTPHMARLTAEADIAVGAAGSTTWERCTLGLPSLMVVLADNQRQAAQALAERGAALVVEADAADFEPAFDRALMRLMTDEGLRKRRAAASAAVCDGQGAPRVAEAFLKLIATRTV